MSREDSFNVPTASGLGVLSRLFCLLFSIGLSALVLMASQLSPAPGGLGTHQQLGLPPCSIRILYGIRCPACGMTTSWAHLTHLEIVSALSANVAGVVLGLITALAIPVLSWMAWTGRVLNGVTSWGFAVGLVLVLVIAMIEWIVRIA